MLKFTTLFIALFLFSNTAQATDFHWQDYADKQHSLAEYQGKPIILHIWASWCGPCRSELPAVDAWREAHPEMTMVAVSLDKYINDASDFISQKSLRMPALLTSNNEVFKLGVRGLPTTLLLDAQGNIIARYIGEQDWQNKTFNKQITNVFMVN